VRVIDRASDMSLWIDSGMAEFLLAGPTQTSVEPLCSNSLEPSCVRLAPDTNDRTTFVGNRSSSCFSTPSVFVVFTSMHVCCGVTTDWTMSARL
jgi:hypothetical protein